TRNVFALTLPDRLLAANDILTIGFAPDSNNAPASELFFNRANLEFLLSFPLAAPRAFIRSPKRGRLATLTRKPAFCDCVEAKAIAVPSGTRRIVTSQLVEQEDGRGKQVGTRISHALVAMLTG